MMPDFEWVFNMKVFVQAYQDLGYMTQSDDWNVRFFHDGEIRIDNYRTRATTTYLVDEGILTVEFRPWDVEIADPKSQNIDLLQTNYGWRNSNLEPEPSPSPEAVAFLNHLNRLGLYPAKIEGEYDPGPDD